MSDKYVINFCKDCIEVLKEYDAGIRNNLIKSEYAGFYKNDFKGLGVYSITEPILKFLIFSRLCKKYQIWPESPFYHDKKILDIAMFSKKIESVAEGISPDIAIEMKWAGFTKAGAFNKWSLDSCIDDLYKLHKECDIENKYFMQFVICDEHLEWVHQSLKEQIYSTIDRRKIRGKNIEFLIGESFDTFGVTVEARKKFNILIWKLV